MTQIPIIGRDGQPILYAYLFEGDLRLEFEIFDGGSGLGGYEFTHTVAQVDFVKILEKFNLETNLEILIGIQQISDAGKGSALKKALTNKEIPNEFFSWIS